MAFECPNCHGDRRAVTSDSVRGTFDRCLDCGYPPETFQEDLHDAPQTTTARRAPEKAVKPRARKR